MPPTDQTSSDTTSPANATNAPPERKTYTFGEMQLSIGDRLQVECRRILQERRALVRLIGYVDGLSLIVSTPVISGKRVELVEGDDIIVRAFSRQNAFAFRCTALRICRLPLDYVHLSFPTVIQGSVIRQSARVKTDIAVEVRNVSQSETPVATGRIANISATGALLCTRGMLARRGDQLEMRFILTLHETDMSLKVMAEVLSAHPAAEGENPDPELSFGVGFREPSPDARVQIKSFVYQQIIEHPRNII